MQKKYKISAIIILSIVFCFYLTGCLHFRTTPKKVQKLFAEHGFAVQSKTISSGDRSLHFIRTNFQDSTKPLVIFVHGSPGSSDNFKDNLWDSSLHAHFEMISVDRPGFGYSDFGKSLPRLKDQSSFMKALIDSFSDRKIILVGHSYGGPLIIQMAIDMPNQISGLVIVAGSVDPDLEPHEWWRKPANTAIGRFIIPKIMEVSNEEIIPLKGDLQILKSSWIQIKQPVCILQGEDDDLVPPGNATFAKNQLLNSKWVQVKMIQDMNHFIPFTKHKLITNALIELKQHL